MLSIIGLYVKNSKIHVDLAIEILSAVVKRFGLGVPAYLALVDELESKNVVEAYREGLKAEKTSKRHALESKNGVLMAATQFLTAPTEMYTVCRLNKQLLATQLFRLKKRCLEEPIETQAARLKLWNVALDLAEPSGDYDRIKSAHLYIDKTTEDVIRMDVQRTFSSDKSFDKERLFSLLRCGTIALQNSAGYCQGMNYIGGMLMYMGLSENEAFDLYVALIQRKMSVLFDNNFEQMKAFFYVLENVLLVCAPEVAAELKAKKVETGYFCSSWFITLFSSSFQYTHSSPLCLNIIDMFIADGFRAMFRSIVALLSFYKHRIMGRTFEETMEFLSDFVQLEAFKGTRYAEYAADKKKGVSGDILKAKYKHWEEYDFVMNFKATCKSIKITHTFISRLQERYATLGARLNRL